MASQSWLDIPKDSPFSLANIPFGIISTAVSATPRPAIAIGDYALDLFTFASAGGFSKLPALQSHIDVFAQPVLNDFAALGRPVHRQVREWATRSPSLRAEDHLFGVVLMNDWSARDIQAWEYIPLGPFNAKNFATTITPWIVLMDALEPFRTQGLEPGNRDSLLPYLREKRADTAYDIDLEFELKNKGGQPTVVAKTNAKNLLYSFSQMLAHHSVTGCNMNTGDLLGSGTISGKEPGMYGSLLENTNGGKVAIKLADGTERKFLEDGDEVTLRGFAGQEGGYVGFGDCFSVIEPAHPIN
ncbi:fumarylacetoacetate hydrolase FahA [Coccidioides immitis H538.4]|uniref:Fumarylacetoacetase n=1 Tax=Coccidioides immitis H538.4 TaxID=396776 RepID=A0A0J8RFT3_COCIT|nr:fumarylacetoacetate hydrolase FahA [Coccidioides immitis H538.4]